LKSLKKIPFDLSLEATPQSVKSVKFVKMAFYCPSVISTPQKGSSFERSQKKALEDLGTKFQHLKKDFFLEK
jgi:hypothetical protein